VAAVWIAHVAPGAAALRGYERGWLRHDVLAGVTMAAYLVPPTAVPAYERWRAARPPAGAGGSGEAWADGTVA
jgi:MFS superfamily sulfate permease-like transporter